MYRNIVKQNTSKCRKHFSLILRFSAALSVLFLFFSKWGTQVGYWSVMKPISYLSSRDLLFLIFHHLFNLILCCRLSFGPPSLPFSVFPLFFRLIPTDSTLPPLPPSHSPSCPLTHHSLSPSAGTRPNKRRWDASSVTENFKICLQVVMACAQFFVWTLSELLFICFLPPVFPPFHLSPLGGLRARLHSSSSVPNFLKFQFLAPVQENEYSEPKHRYFHTLAQFVCPVRSNQQTDQNKELHCTKSNVCHYLIFIFLLCLVLFQGHSCSVLSTGRIWGRWESVAQPSPLLEAADIPASCYTPEKYRTQW